jgi:hypothetical protein
MNLSSESGYVLPRFTFTDFTGLRRRDAEALSDNAETWRCLRGSQLTNLYDVSCRQFRAPVAFALRLVVESRLVRTRVLHAMTFRTQPLNVGRVVMSRVAVAMMAMQFRMRKVAVFAGFRWYWEEPFGAIVRSADGDVLTTPVVVRFAFWCPVRHVEILQ